MVTEDKEDIRKRVNRMAQGELIRTAKRLNVNPTFVDMVEKGVKKGNSYKIKPFKKYYRDVLESRIIKQLSGDLMEHSKR